MPEPEVDAVQAVVCGEGSVGLGQEVSDVISADQGDEPVEQLEERAWILRSSLRKISPPGNSIY